MNERFKEMAKQASESVAGAGFTMAKYEEKFAELIVRECASLAYDGPSGILEHFGVEQMTNDELMQKLQKAQELLSDVYAWASYRAERDDFSTFARNPEVERLMSVADECIIDALEALEWDRNE